MFTKKLFFIIAGVVMALVLVVMGLWSMKTSRALLLGHNTVVVNSLASLLGEGGVAERYNLAYYYFADPEARTLERAEQLLQATLSEESDEQSLMLLSRVYFAQEELDQVIQSADTYLEEYPEGTRMYYIRGLALAYDSRLDLAEADFKVFIDKHPNEWAGYLDLSWIYFQKGELGRSREIIEEGYAQFPDNPWIASAFGVVLLNRQEVDKARFIMQQAVRSAQELSLEEWTQAYTASDPSRAQEDLDLFIKTLEYNLGLTDTPSDEATSTPEWVNDIPFASPALRGVEYGFHVSACNSSCPACNECGDCQGYAEGNHRYQYHTYHSCAPPALREDYGQQCVSADNVCAQNTQGVIGCDGCTASMPEAPLPNADGYAYVPQSGQIYIYEANSFGNSPMAQTCYSFNNSSGEGVFVPLKTRAEFEAFIQSSEIDGNPDFELSPL